MKWLRRKLRDWIHQADYDEKVADVGISSREVEHRPEEDPILSFRIYGATNGQILEFRRWDRKQDRSHSSTYIIEKDKDVGEFVTKCLSLELLK